jgi:hypothetical protein
MLAAALVPLAAHSGGALEVCAGRRHGAGRRSGRHLVLHHPAHRRGCHGRKQGRLTVLAFAYPLANLLLLLGVATLICAARSTEIASPSTS